MNSDRKSFFSELESAARHWPDLAALILGPDVNVNSARMELTSLKMLEVIVGLETEFGITIADDAPLAQITSLPANSTRKISLEVGNYGDGCQRHDPRQSRKTDSFCQPLVRETWRAGG